MTVHLQSGMSFVIAYVVFQRIWPLTLGHRISFFIRMRCRPLEASPLPTASQFFMSVGFLMTNPTVYALRAMIALKAAFSFAACFVHPLPRPQNWPLTIIKGDAVGQQQTTMASAHACLTQ